MRRSVFFFFVGAVLATLAWAPSAQAAYTATLDSTPKPGTVGAQITLTATGHVDGASVISWYAQPGATPCASSEDVVPWEASWVATSMVPAGDYLKGETFTPETPGPYRVCAYVYADSDTTSDPPRVTPVPSLLISPAVPASTATITVVGPAAPKTGDTVTLRVSGMAGLEAQVTWFADPGVLDCADTADNEASRLHSTFVDSRYVAKGPYAVEGQFEPSVSGTYHLCAYLSHPAFDSESQPPRVKATALLDVAGTPAPVTPPTVATPGTSPSASMPSMPGLSDPTGVLKLTVAGGKPKRCGAGCMSRARTAGPFSLVLKVRVKGSKVLATGTVRDTKKSAQAGKAGKVCLNSFSTKFKQSCRKLTWKAGLKVTLSASIAKPAKVNKSSRPGFTLSAFVGDLAVPATSSIYLKAAGGTVVPDTDESSCLARVRAHAAC